MLLVSEINRRTKTTLKSYLVKVFFIWQSNDFADEWQLILFQSEKLILPSLTMISNQCFLFLIQRCMWNEGYIQRETPFSVIYVQLRFLDIQCNLGTVNYTGIVFIYHIETTRLHLQFGKANHTRSSIFIKYQKFTIIHTNILQWIMCGGLYLFHTRQYIKFT